MVVVSRPHLAMWIVLLFFFFMSVLIIRDFDYTCFLNFFPNNPVVKFWSVLYELCYMISLKIVHEKLKSKSRFTTI